MFDFNGSGGALPWLMDSIRHDILEDGNELVMELSWENMRESGRRGF
jgi:hypothetical protein